MEYINIFKYILIATNTSYTLLYGFALAYFMIAFHRKFKWTSSLTLKIKLIRKSEIIVRWKCYFTFLLNKSNYIS